MSTEENSEDNYGIGEMTESLEAITAEQIPAGASALPQLMTNNI